MAARPAPSVRVATSSGPIPVIVTSPTGPGPWPGVVVIHDAGGMTDDLVSQTQWLAEAGFLVAAPDLLRGGTIARCLRDIIRSYSAWEGRTFEQIEAVRAWLSDRPDCTGKVGIIGFCLGGGFALGLAPGHGFDAASANYGALPKDADRYFAGACPIVGSYGRRDRSLRGAADRLRRSLEAAGVVHDVHEYPDAGHGFMNDHGPGEIPLIFQLLGATVHTAFHEPSAIDARRRITSFFHEHLGRDPVPDPALHRP